MWISKSRLNSLENDVKDEINVLKSRVYSLEHPLKYEDNTPLGIDKTILRGYCPIIYNAGDDIIQNKYLVRFHSEGVNKVLSERDIDEFFEDDKILNERKIVNG